MGEEVFQILLNRYIRYIGVHEAAEITGLAVRTVIQLCKDGKAEAVKIGGRYIIAEDWATEERKRRTAPDGCITASEAAKIAGVSRQRIHKLIAKGKIQTASRTGWRIWIDRHSLELWKSSRDERGI